MALLGYVVWCVAIGCIFWMAGCALLPKNRDRRTLDEKNWDFIMGPKLPCVGHEYNLDPNTCDWCGSLRQYIEHEESETEKEALARAFLDIEHKESETEKEALARAFLAKLRGGRGASAPRWTTRPSSQDSRDGASILHSGGSSLDLTPIEKSLLTRYELEMIQKGLPKITQREIREIIKQEGH